jgi:hypothetical protein
VEIEDQYRSQFKQMYPDYPMCSRWGKADMSTPKVHSQIEFKPVKKFKRKFNLINTKSCDNQLGNEFAVKEKASSY